MFLFNIRKVITVHSSPCRLGGRRSCKYPNDLLDFILADGSVPVHVVQREGPLQLLQGLSPGGEVQRHDVLLEVQGAVCVGVKAPEHVPRIRRGVGVGKEAGVDALKLLLADLPAGTLLQEGLVPGAEIGLAVLRVGLQVLQELLGQSAALCVPHPARTCSNFLPCVSGA